MNTIISWFRAIDFAQGDYVAASTGHTTAAEHEPISSLTPAPSSADNRATVLQAKPPTHPTVRAALTFSVAPTTQTVVAPQSTPTPIQTTAAQGPVVVSAPPIQPSSASPAATIPAPVAIPVQPTIVPSASAVPTPTPPSVAASTQVATPTPTSAPIGQPQPQHQPQPAVMPTVTTSVPSPSSATAPMTASSTASTQSPGAQQTRTMIEVPVSIDHDVGEVSLGGVEIPIDATVKEFLDEVIEQAGSDKTVDDLYVELQEHIGFKWQAVRVMDDYDEQLPSLDRSRRQEFVVHVKLD